MRGNRCGRRLLGRRRLLSGGDRRGRAGHCRLRRLLGRRRGRLGRWRWGSGRPAGRYLGRRAHVAGPVDGRRAVVGRAGRGRHASTSVGRRTGARRATAGSLRRASFVVHVQVVMTLGVDVAAVRVGVMASRDRGRVRGRVAAVGARVAVLPLRRLLLLWLPPARVRHAVAVAERQRVHEVGTHSPS